MDADSQEASHRGVHPEGSPSRPGQVALHSTPPFPTPPASSTGTLAVQGWGWPIKKEMHHLLLKGSDYLLAKSIASVDALSKPSLRENEILAIRRGSQNATARRPR